MGLEFLFGVGGLGYSSSEVNSSAIVQYEEEAVDRAIPVHIAKQLDGNGKSIDVFEFNIYGHLRHKSRQQFKFLYSDESGVNDLLTHPQYPKHVFLLDKSDSSKAVMIPRVDVKIKGKRVTSDSKRKITKDFIVQSPEEEAFEPKPIVIDPVVDDRDPQRTSNSSSTPIDHDKLVEIGLIILAVGGVIFFSR